MLNSSQKSALFLRRRKVALVQCCALLLSGWFLIIPNSVCAQTRVALVVGNNAYLRLPPLNNAVNAAAASGTSCEIDCEGPEGERSNVEEEAAPAK